MPADRAPMPFLFSAPDADRLADRRDDVAWLEAALSSPAARFVPVCGEQSSLHWQDKKPTPILLSVAEAKPHLAAAHCTVLLGDYAGHTCFALGLAADALPAADLCNLRRAFGLLPAGDLALLGYARAMVHWHARHRHCGVCGTPNESRRGGHERKCPRCGNQVFPRLDPAIIVLVTQSERCLLGRQMSWPEHQFSTLAGFVEPGETLEAAVQREVLEETNIHVATPVYQASQPWPFPSSIMLGFRAEAESGEIRCNDGELAEARWFSRDDIVARAAMGIPVLPPSLSVSFRLIRDWFEERPGYSMARLAERNPGVFRA